MEPDVSRTDASKSDVSKCRICAGEVRKFFDFGTQPLSDAFLTEREKDQAFHFRLAVGLCTGCTMVQLLEEVPRERMFHHDYPYHSSGSRHMREHFAQTAHDLLATELTGPDPFCVEIGSNDGVMLGVIKDAGVRHLGVEPSGGVAELARKDGVRVRTDFFEESTARLIAAEDGPADVVYAANTICHIPYLDSILRGVDVLLRPGGVFVFEDPYLGDIAERNTFDQIYDEHFYLFTARSVRGVARRFGFELVDVRRLPVHGGEVRYTLARRGEREVSPAVPALIAEEAGRGLAELETLEKLGNGIDRICADLVALLEDLRRQGRSVAGYGATAKSATVTNYAGIGPELLPCVYDTTPAKIGRLMPGSGIPIRAAGEFSRPYPDYAVLFAWNHTDEILAREAEFAARGGKWIVYVPEVRVL
ncbi:class I SAM-dependent methyltransferase [Nonomuraea sp. MCN248]|uniref:Class I SAM-dependent methyltransferase n=1 Tax=Nonomuraea corallina TaxID=2989783 RepID=A0ABT4SLV6_9ACTN|nr:class I SAM-dependent methyltransferase [Nonomuraea corallina]MDA0638174.1 class I SAM-dependent methyltransferase [Nonomuraea corallina]